MESNRLLNMAVLVEDGENDCAGVRTQILASDSISVHSVIDSNRLFSTKALGCEDMSTLLLECILERINRCCS